MQTPEEVTTFDAPKLAQILTRTLKRAIKVGNAALIFVQYESNFDRKEAQNLLSQVLKEAQIELVEINLNRDSTDFFELVLNLTKHQVGSIWGLHAQPELIRALNWRREHLADNFKHLIFWLDTDELGDVTSRAPDFWAFRNRYLRLSHMAKEFYTSSYNSGQKSMEYFRLPLEEKKDRIEALEEILRDAKRRNQLSIRVIRILSDLGLLYVNIGNYPAAIKNYKEAVILAHKLDQIDIHAELNSLGIIYKSLGDYETAITYYNQALAITRAIGNKSDEEKTVGNLGNLYSETGNYQKALEFYRKALEIAVEIEDDLGIARWIGNTGSTYRQMGKYDLAIQNLTKALALNRESGDKNSEAIVLLNLAETYLQTEDYSKAISSALQALSISKLIGNILLEASILDVLGICYWAQEATHFALPCWIVSSFIFNQVKANPRMLNQVLDSLDKVTNQIYGPQPRGDELLEQATGQKYTFFRDHPEWPAQLLKLVEEYSQKQSAQPSPQP